MRPLFLHLQRHDRLAVQFEAVFLERIVDTRCPLHLAAPAHQVDVVFLEAVDAVTAGFLGGGAGAVRSAQQVGNVLVVGRNRHDADADAEAEGAIVPHELVVADRRTQVLGGLHGLIEVAALEQYAELVAAEPRQGVAPADLRLEQVTELVQQGVAGTVPAGIVDDFELVEVEIQQRIRGLACLGAFQCALQAALEFAPVDQPGEDVVAGVVAQAAVEFARLADVVEYEHAARDDALAVANR